MKLLLLHLIMEQDYFLFQLLKYFSLYVFESKVSGSEVLIVQ